MRTRRRFPRIITEYWRSSDTSAALIMARLIGSIVAEAHLAEDHLTDAAAAEESMRPNGVM